MLRRFTGGNPDTRAHLNELVDAINGLMGISGDGLVRVSRDSRGLTGVSLNMDGVRKRIGHQSEFHYFRVVNGTDFGLNNVYYNYGDNATSDPDYSARGWFVDEVLPSWMKSSTVLLDSVSRVGGTYKPTVIKCGWPYSWPFYPITPYRYRDHGGYNYAHPLVFRLPRDVYWGETTENSFTYTAPFSRARWSEEVNALTLGYTPQPVQLKILSTLNTHLRCAYVCSTSLDAGGVLPTTQVKVWRAYDYAVPVSRVFYPAAVVGDYIAAQWVPYYWSGADYWLWRLIDMTPRIPIQALTKGGTGVRVRVDLALDTYGQLWSTDT